MRHWETGFRKLFINGRWPLKFRYVGLDFEREYNMKIYYRNQEVGERRVDFFVANKIMVELKALICLENVHLAQGKNYLEAYNLEVGLLINFGATSLQFKRLENLKYKPGPNPLNP